MSIVPWVDRIRRSGREAGWVLRARQNEPPAPPARASGARREGPQNGSRATGWTGSPDWQLASGVAPISPVTVRPVQGLPSWPATFLRISPRGRDTIDKSYVDYKRMLKRQPLASSESNSPVLDPHVSWCSCRDMDRILLTRQITVPIQALAEGTKAITFRQSRLRVLRRRGTRSAS